jgi:hypothetical protein
LGRKRGDLEAVLSCAFSLAKTVEVRRRQCYRRGELEDRYSPAWRCNETAIGVVSIALAQTASLPVVVAAAERTQLINQKSGGKSIFLERVSLRFGDFESLPSEPRYEQIA